MSNLRIGYQNAFDLATLTVTPALAAAGPASYLQNDAREFALATSTASQEVKGTWGGTAYTISEFDMHRHNLLFGDTIQTILYPNLDWTGTPLYDSTALAAYASGLFTTWGWAFTNRYFGPFAGVKSFKIIIGATTTAWQAARIYLGDFIEAPYNPQYGLQRGLGSNSRQRRSEGGSLRSLARATWREVAFDMQVKLEADRAAWEELSRACDVVKSFVACFFPGVGGTTERDFTYFGKFDGKAPGTKLAGILRYDMSVKIAEL